MVWPAGDTRQFPPSEIATLTVDGKEFRNWKTVRVKLEVGSPWQEYQFTAAEPIDIHSNLLNWRIQPGMWCTVALGGVPVIGGRVEIREGSYNATEHGVMFFGRSFGSTGHDSSVRKEIPDSADGTFTSITQLALTGTNVALQAPGDNGQEHRRFSISKGETPWMVAERLARFVPGLRVTDNGFGTWLAQRVESLDSANYVFLEGNNILEARATIDITHRMNTVEAMAQQDATDGISPKQAHDISAKVVDPTVEAGRYMLCVIEEPGTPQLCMNRARHDMAYIGEAIIHCTVKVYGWFQRPGELFQIYKQYGIDSPMLALSRELWSRQVIFEQSDAGGTTTTIELCTPESLTGQLDAVDPTTVKPGGIIDWTGQGTGGNNLDNPK